MGAISQAICEEHQNKLLASFSRQDMDRWQGQLEAVELSANQTLCAAGDSSAYVYFPTTAVVSLMSLTVDGSTVEVAVIGKDGLVGISSLLGGGAVPFDSVVQSAGRAFRVSARFVKAEIDHSRDVMRSVLGYSQTLLVQMAQTAICNRFHSIDQQVSRRLLAGLDRLPSDEMAMTQEQIAGLLGVRREGVNTAANKLREEGLIRYSRGHIVVLDRQRLEQKTCHCYTPSKKEYSRSLPSLIAA